MLLLGLPINARILEEARAALRAVRVSAEEGGNKVSRLCEGEEDPESILELGIEDAPPRLAPLKPSRTGLWKRGGQAHPLRSSAEVKIIVESNCFEV